MEPMGIVVYIFAFVGVATAIFTIVILSSVCSGQSDTIRNLSLQINKINDKLIVLASSREGDAGLTRVLAGMSKPKTPLAAQVDKPLEKQKDLRGVTFKMGAN